MAKKKKAAAPAATQKKAAADAATALKDAAAAFAAELENNKPTAETLHDFIFKSPKQ